MSDRPTRVRRPGDLIATVLLMIVSVALAIDLGTAPWDIGGGEVAVGVAVSGYGPMLLTLIGIVGGIVALVRRARAFWWPLGAIALSLTVWLIVGAIQVATF